MQAAQHELMAPGVRGKQDVGARCAVAVIELKASTVVLNPALVQACVVKTFLMVPADV